MLNNYWLPTIRAAIELNRGNSARAVELRVAVPVGKISQPPWCMNLRTERSSSSESGAGTVRSALSLGAPIELALFPHVDGLRREIDVCIAGMSDFIFPKAGAQEKLPHLQLVVRRCGVERTQFFHGVCSHFFLCVGPVQTQRDAVAMQECPEVGQSVVDGAVCQPLLFQRYHESLLNPAW